MKKICRMCNNFYSVLDCNIHHFTDDEAAETCKAFDSVFAEVYDHKKETVKRFFCWNASDDELKRVAASYNNLAETLVKEYLDIPYDCEDRSKVKLIAQACLAARMSAYAVHSIVWRKQKAELDKELEEMKKNEQTRKSCAAAGAVQADSGWSV